MHYFEINDLSVIEIIWNDVERTNDIGQLPALSTANHRDSIILNYFYWIFAKNRYLNKYYKDVIALEEIIGVRKRKSHLSSTGTGWSGWWIECKTGKITFYEESWRKTPIKFQIFNNKKCKYKNNHNNDWMNEINETRSS